MTISVYFLGLALLITSTAIASDTSERGEDCSKFDRCRSGDLFRTCSCDSDCHKYATCCSDSDNYELMDSEKDRFICHSDRTHTPVYAKRSCSENYIGHDSHERICTQAISDKADVLGNLLVTSVKTKTTYWNKECAWCNHENVKDIRQWAVQVACPSKHGDMRFRRAYIEDHLTFNKEIEEWGLKVDDGFVVCALTFFQPSSMVGKLEYCAPGLISECPAGFPNNETVQKCLTYHAERKQKNVDVYFRNVHCALCHGVSEDELDCVGRNYGPVNYKKQGDQVKVVFDSGEWLDRDGKEKYQCSHGNSFDPFQHRCREIPESILRLLNETVSANFAQRTTVNTNVLVSILIFILINKYLVY